MNTESRKKYKIKRDDILFLVFTLNFEKNFFHICEVIENQDSSKTHTIWENCISRRGFRIFFGGGGQKFIISIKQEDIQK